VHQEKPFDFAEKAYLLQRDAALKVFVDQWLHIALEDRSFKKVLRRLVRIKPCTPACLRN
jgi:cyclohexadienyl dehydratase